MANSIYDFTDNPIPNYSSSSRLKNVTVVKPIVFGNIARYFGKKREEDNHTHEWTFYLKPFQNEDPSSYIQRVQIKLHDSYTNSSRILTKAPYEVTETGWGEFEIIVKIYFCDPNEKPVTFFHLLKLFSTDQDIIIGKRHLVNEYYDEIIFHEPNQYFYNMLVNTRPLVNGLYTHETDFTLKEHQTIEAIQNAKGKIRKEIRDLKERLKTIQENIHILKEKVETDEHIVDE